MRLKTSYQLACFNFWKNDPKNSLTFPSIWIITTFAHHIAFPVLYSFTWVRYLNGRIHNYISHQNRFHWFSSIIHINSKPCPSQINVCTFLNQDLLKSWIFRFTSRKGLAPINTCSPAAPAASANSSTSVLLKYKDLSVNQLHFYSTGKSPMLVKNFLCWTCKMLTSNRDDRVLYEYILVPNKMLD